MSQVKVSNGPKALIIEPSKELAEQTLNNVKQFKKYVDNPQLRWEPTLLCGSSVYQRARLSRCSAAECVCLCRELLVIGGVAAKEQLSALEQGVREGNGIYCTECLERTGKQNRLYLLIHPCPLCLWPLQN